MRVFERDTCTAVDFIRRRIGVFRLQPRPNGAPAEIAHSDTAFPPADALADEIASFLSAVRGEHPPRVTGEDGRRALEAAIAIDKQLKEHRRRLNL